MKSIYFENEQDWLDARTGRITGTKLGTLFSKTDGKPLKGYYDLIAERIAIPHDGENVMDRGHRLEDHALDRFAKETGKKVDKRLVLWYRDNEEDIASSPDGVIGTTEAVEVKCLNSGSHLRSYLTKTIPSEYDMQILQYFIVNDKLRKLYFVFYDPRMPIDFFYIEVLRQQKQKMVQEYLELERKMLKDIVEIEKKVTF